MRPRVILHNAVSLDGRIDWFTVDIGLFYELASRWQEDATLAGADTLLAAPADATVDGGGEPDTPRPDPNDTRPLLVVPDSRGRLGNWQHWRKAGYWRDVVALCSRATPRECLDSLARQQVDTIVAGDNHVDLRDALKQLHARFGVQVVRVDSGGMLNGVLLRAGLVDEVSLLVHPTLVGGLSPCSMFRATDLTDAAGLIRLKLQHVERLRDEIVWLRYEVVAQDRNLTGASPSA